MDKALLFIALGLVGAWLARRSLRGFLALQSKQREILKGLPVVDLPLDDADPEVDLRLAQDALRVAQAQDLEAAAWVFWREAKRYKGVRREYLNRRAFALYQLHHKLVYKKRMLVHWGTIAFALVLSAIMWLWELFHGAQSF